MPPQIMIDPNFGKAGNKFHILDKPAHRIVNGTVAVFTLNGNERTVPLEPQANNRKGQGTLPDDFVKATYLVSVRPPSEPEFEVGSWEVKEGVDLPPIEDPYVEPTQVQRGQPFTLTDPQARMELGDDLRLVPPSGAFSEGTVPEGLDISADGTTATGKVPLALSTGAYTVEVREPGATVPLFPPVPLEII